MLHRFLCRLDAESAAAAALALPAPPAVGRSELDDAAAAAALALPTPPSAAFACTGRLEADADEEGAAAPSAAPSSSVGGSVSMST